MLLKVVMLKNHMIFHSEKIVKIKVLINKLDLELKIKITSIKNSREYKIKKNKRINREIYKIKCQFNVIVLVLMVFYNKINV
jgi:hypothetical protein